MESDDVLIDSRKVCDTDPLLSARSVREENGGISKGTFIRWRKNEALAFPDPDAVINGRNYWLRSTIKAWRARAFEAALRRREVG